MDTDRLLNTPPVAPARPNKLGMPVAPTPGRASFAGFARQASQSPSFRDIARRIMQPTDKVKPFKEVRNALVNATAMLIVVFILITLYAVNVVIVPHLKTLLLALLFGSFLHPMKRSVSHFFKRILKEIHDHDQPIIAGLFMPVTIVDRVMERLRANLVHYAHEVVNFCKKILNGDLRSALAVCLAAMSLAIIGGGSLINFVMCTNLIIFITDLTKTSTSFSDAYLHFLMRSFGLAQFCWLNPQIIFLLLIIFTLWVGISWLVGKLKQYLYELNQQVNEVGDGHNNRPSQLRIQLNRTYDSLKEVYRLIVDQMEEYVDTLSSACVIGIVAFIVIFLALYLSFQVYIESIYLIEKAGSSANAIQENNPELKSWLPDWLNVVHFLIDAAVKNIYQQGREWIRSFTRQMLSNANLDEYNSTETTMIEKQMVEFWDRAYDIWQKNRANGTSTVDGHFRRGSRPYDWNKLFEALQSLDFTLCAKIFKQNWNTLISVMGSVTKVLKGNLNLAVNLVTVVLSLLVLWANVLINFIIDLIVFTTALFYLLCASDEEYKPIELLKDLMPKSKASLGLDAERSTNRDEFLNLVDESINAVFTASLKMMAFHGLSTWLLHMLFQREVVYVPSVVSALFAVVPFIAPYWASVPACLDLWLSGQVLQAVLMFLLATIPSSFVTTAFYSEIKGAGHPYLTGLAIAAGIFVFGIQGALFGPMLLVSIRLLPLILVYFMDICK